MTLKVKKKGNNEEIYLVTGHGVAGNTAAIGRLWWYRNPGTSTSSNADTSPNSSSGTSTNPDSNSSANPGSGSSTSNCVNTAGYTPHAGRT
jgi:hypothetical protein